MEYTANYNLKLPEYTDAADIQDLNDNFEAIDTALAGMKTKQTAVADPTASGTADAFIATISQDENGEITVTKKNAPKASVVNSAATLAWGTLKKIGSVAGTDLTVKLPANPNTWRNYKIKSHSITPVYVAANGIYTVPASDMNVSTPSGYFPAAVLAFSPGESHCSIDFVNGAATGSDGIMRIRNNSNSGRECSPSIKILYLKDD